jgi:dihydrofolate reductase
MNISLIVAFDRTYGIGKENDLPWKGKLPRDMKHFKELTLGKTVIMGRKTFESIGRPLPMRTNIVLSRQPSQQKDGVIFVNSLEGALQIAAKDLSGIFIIGGAELFRQALPIAQYLYLTEIDAKFDCDTFFPRIDEELWIETQTQEFPIDDVNFFPIRFRTLERIAI